MNVLRPLTAVLVLLCSYLSANAQMTHEEQTVRATYAKLAYATRLGVLKRNVLGAGTGNQALDNPVELKRQMDAALAFHFESFTVGNLADIETQRWDSLVEKPTGDLVSIGSEYVPYVTLSGGVTEMNCVDANWSRVDEQGGSLDWSMPLKRVIADLPLDTLKPETSYSRYAAYSVTVQLADRSRTYRGLFLFGRNPDHTEAVFPIDHILGMGSLNFVMEHSLYPQPFLETNIRNWPGIREWIGTLPLESDSTAKDIVCDGTTGQCGIPRRVLQQALALKVGAEPKFTPKSGASTAIPSSGTMMATPTPTTCAGYDSVVNWSTTDNPAPTAFGTVNHSSGGQHSVSQNATGSCSFSSGGTPACNTICVVQTAPGSLTSETGATVSKNCHVVGMAWAQGNSAATNGGTTCTAQLYGGATECASAACNCTISVSAGGIISGSPTLIWSQADPVPLTCNGVADPTYQSGGGGGTGCELEGGSGGPPNLCVCACGGGGGNCGDSIVCSPIVIDTTGQGFHLGKAAEGVIFDIRANGHPVRVAWPDTGSGNAFLVLDRNHNGKIDSGREMFGNITYQPESPDLNGYLALAVYDKPENGGNGDGIIDSRDEVFSQLRLWIDANHDGISEPSELHTLPELGVYSISLKYRPEAYVDANGNQFRYRGILNPDPSDRTSKDGRYTYDVFLRIEPSVPAREAALLRRDQQLQ